MKITYDKEANAAYLYFKKFRSVSKTLPITEDVIVDLDSKGKILGIEILNASSHVAIKDLKGFKLRMLGA